VRADRARPDIRIDDHCATAFFRVLQESLSNILQHAHASLVRVELRQADGMLSMTISDNGIGLATPAATRPARSAWSASRSASACWAAVLHHGSPDGGTTVAIAVPLSKRPRQHGRPPDFAL
jgi:signal transduction histidine kinase